MFEQISREELLARQLEANARVLTQQVTEQVTRQVTQQVTEQVTQQVKKNDILISYKMLLEAGIAPENALQSIVRNYNLEETEVRKILE